MSDLEQQQNACDTPWWQPILFTAMAGGMAWGIRGQYGHETGAMIAGSLVSLTLVLLLCPHGSSLSLARAIAWGTLGMGIGGSMTYGQTVGLTHDGPLVGNWEAFRWGMLGLAVKGGIYISFGGLLLGMGLSAVRYRPLEILLLILAALGMHVLGLYLLNSPFDPANKVLPTIYFSDDWYFEPEGGFKPRFECWGGYLLALTTMIVYTGWYRQDRLALNLALWGLLGGALGFPGGQCFQAYNAWNDGGLAGTIWSRLAMNSWNMMEVIFGTIMGAVLGLGAWRNRRLMQPTSIEDEERFPFGIEIALLAVHLPMLIAVEFVAIKYVDALYDLGLILVLIPIVAIAGGRWWPFWQVLPLTMLPIAGKTIRALVPNNVDANVAIGAICYGVIPVAVGMALAMWAGQDSRRKHDGHAFVRWSLLVVSWTYFYLNFAFWGYPWPWKDPAGPFSRGLVYSVSIVGLTILVCVSGKRTQRATLKLNHNGLL
jgi:hypothetical protein